MFFCTFFSENIWIYAIEIRGNPNAISRSHFNIKIGHVDNPKRSLIKSTQTLFFQLCTLWVFNLKRLRDFNGKLSLVSVVILLVKLWLLMSGPTYLAQTFGEPACIFLLRNLEENVDVFLFWSVLFRHSGSLIKGWHVRRRLLFCVYDTKSNNNPQKNVFKYE